MAVGDMLASRAKALQESRGCITQLFRDHCSAGLAVLEDAFCHRNQCENVSVDIQFQELYFLRAGVGRFLLVKS